jgi:hypothetical protein
VISRLILEHRLELKQGRWLARLAGVRDGELMRYLFAEKWQGLRTGRRPNGKLWEVSLRVRSELESDRQISPASLAFTAPAFGPGGVALWRSLNLTVN